ncbi:MAG: hypothetical protein E7Y34_01585, partial [Mycoplasma sp.]|nr:hypothetical protein [Mycoplasma sp.]
MDKKLINIGLDIGIASVGWCIADQDLNILEHGVRLFETVDSAKDSKLLNEIRREKRHARRLINRRKVLKRDFIKLLYEQKLINFNSKWSFENDFFEIKQWFLNSYIIEKDNKYDRKNYKDVLLTLRKKAYENKIALEELIRVLYWYLSNRGFKYEIAGDKEYQKLVEKLNIDKNKLPFEIQLDEYQKDSDLNKFRGSKNRLLHNNDYWKEIEVILDNHSNLLSSKFKDNYQKLFKRQRNFENG